MADPSRSARSRAWSFLRRRLVAGFVTLFPLAVTVWIAKGLLGFLDGIIGKYLVDVPGLGLLVLFLLLLLTGTLVRSYVGAKLFALHDAVLSRVPLARAVYLSAKQLVEALDPAGRSSFQRVVLVEYPRRGLYAVGFVTKEAAGELQMRTAEQVSCVFIPTTPNPTSGVLLLVPQAEIVPLSMTVEEGVKLIVSGGLVAPEFSTEVGPAPPAAGG